MHYSKIKHWDIANGEGVRISLFVSGCLLHCEGCFNQEAWDFNSGSEYTESTESEIISLVSDDNIDGLSILGGDPMCQSEDGIDALKRLVSKVKSMGKNVWIWSGYTWDSIMQCGTEAKKELISMCDVMVDGPFIASRKDLRLRWRGSSNQRVIDVKASIENNSVVIYRGGN